MEYNVIDADGHICEPPDLWERYIDPKYREGCPKLITLEGGEEILRIEGDYAISLSRGKQKVSFGGVGAFGSRDGKVSPKIPYAEGRKGGFDPHARIPDSFFGGLELVPPGVISVRCWYGDGPARNLKPRTATFLGGVARKP